VRGDEVRDLFIQQAERFEKMAAEESAGVAPIRARPVPSLRRGVAPLIGNELGPVGIPSPPPMAPMYLESARSCRWFADHVETDRVFRLGVHDLGFIGLSVLHSCR
jgi:hypothetical protein